MSIYDLLAKDHEKEREGLFTGVTVGIVTNINDPEKLGRLKVKLINRDSSEYETDFIRVLTPMTGKEWGSFFFPEVGDEVLVAFGHGSLARPYVLGSLWNKNYQPPTKIQDSKNDIRMIKTKSGHQIIFNDEKGKESIELKTPKELSLTLDDEKEVITIKDKEGQNIVKIDSKNGQLTIEAPKKIKVNSGNSSVILDAQANSVSIESNSSINIKSQQININAQATMQISAANLLNIKSDGATNVKGAVVKIN